MCNCFVKIKSWCELYFAFLCPKSRIETRRTTGINVRTSLQLSWESSAAPVSLLLSLISALCILTNMGMKSGDFSVTFLGKFGSACCLFVSLGWFLTPGAQAGVGRCLGLSLHGKLLLCEAAPLPRDRGPGWCGCCFVCWKKKSLRNM